MEKGEIRGQRRRQGVTARQAVRRPRAGRNGLVPPSATGEGVTLSTGVVFLREEIQER